MAIQNRRGAYVDLNPAKAVPGELLVVQSGDPNATDGKSVYMTFDTGDIKRLATESDVATMVADATDEIVQDLEDTVEGYAERAETAASNAEDIVDGAEAAIVAKGVEVVDSIPSDYTALTSDVSDLKSAFNDSQYIVKGIIDNDANIPIPFVVERTGYISSTGEIGSSSNAGHTNYIDVSAFSTIKYKRINLISGGNWNTAFYNSAYEMIDKYRNPYNQDVFSYEDTLYQINVPDGAKYARFTTIYDTDTYGNFELYAVNSIASTFGNLDFIKSEIKIGKNLYNPEVTESGYISTNQGKINSHTSYITSDFIPVKNGEPVVINRLRDFLAFTTNKEPIQESYVSSVKYNYVYTPDQDGFIRASLFVESSGVNMIAYGSALPDYEPYKETKIVEENIHLSDTMTEDVEEIVSAMKGDGKKLTVIVDNDSYTLFSQYGTDAKLKRTLSYGKRNNRTFEFENAYIVDTNGTSTLIKESTDDITPLRLGANGSSRTVGANHGWAMFYVPVGSFTVADAGSVWTDGTNNYILAMVDSNYAYFIPPAEMSGDSYVYNTDVPITNLTHVSGATHTGEVSIDGITSGNLIPSVNNRNHKIYADGAEITEDGTYYCDHFTVYEQYTIMDYVAIGEYLKANIGTDLLTADEIAGCVRQSIRYVFGETDCVVAHSTEALKPVYYFDCGFLQAIPSAFTEKHFYRYGNGVNNDSPLYSANLLDQTSDSGGIKINPTELADPDIPMNRSVDLVKDDNGNLTWGFTTGFIPDISYGSNANRKLLTSFWSIRNDTRKSYPAVFRYRHADTGFYADILGYRNYLRPGLDITNETKIEIGDALYVIVDAHTQQTNRHITVDEKYIGKTITVLEPVNFALSSDIVGTHGIVFSTTSAYGCAVLKVS